MATPPTTQLGVTPPLSCCLIRPQLRCSNLKQNISNYIEMAMTKHYMVITPVPHTQTNLQSRWFRLCCWGKWQPSFSLYIKSSLSESRKAEFALEKSAINDFKEWFSFYHRFMQIAHYSQLSFGKKFRLNPFIEREIHENISMGF